MSNSNRFKAVVVAGTPAAENVWKKVIEQSPDAWFWHSWIMLQHTLEAAASSLNPVNLSFFVYDGDALVGLVPLVVRDNTEDGTTVRMAAYHPGIGFLPWPACMSVDDREDFEDFAFEELERRARNAGASFIRIRYTPPINQGHEEVQIGRIAEKFGYTQSQFESHVVSIGPETLGNVRVGSRQYQKKFSTLFEMIVLDGEAMSNEFEEHFFRLHVLDSGGQFRSRESYTKQADCVRAGEAFFVAAVEKESGAIAGMLLVSLFKGAAYDASVAIDPKFNDKRVGHLLKWRAIEELLERGIATYELGIKAGTWIPPRESTKKEFGISEFKEGWSRGRVRTMWQIEKKID